MHPEKLSNNMNKFLISAVALVSLCACSGRENDTATPPRSVITVTPDGAVGKSLTFAGVVEEDENISIGFKTPGQIQRVYVREGDNVRSGQLLAELDAADYRLGVDALQIQYDQLSQEVERLRKLYEKKSVPANEYDKAVAGLRQLAVQLQANKNKLAYTRLYAPASGIIESVNFAKGEMVDAGTAVFTLLHTGAMEIVCDIPADVYARRAAFRSFSGIPTGSRDNRIPLRLVSIIPKADGNQLYRMRLAFAGGKPAHVTPGMNIEVAVGLGETSGRMTVPASAVFRHDGKTCVWIVGKDSTVSLRAVTIGETLLGDRIDVLSGLNPEDILVRSGASALHQGEKVKIVERPAETNVGGLL